MRGFHRRGLPSPSRSVPTAGGGSREVCWWWPGAGRVLEQELLRPLHPVRHLPLPGEAGGGRHQTDQVTETRGHTNSK